MRFEAFLDFSRHGAAARCVELAMANNIHGRRRLTWSRQPRNVFDDGQQPGFSLHGD
jgi:hypothetical protein